MASNINFRDILYQAAVLPLTLLMHVVILINGVLLMISQRGGCVKYVY